MRQFLRLVGPSGALLPITLWAALWVNLNTGPWLVGKYGNALDYLVFLQVYAPVGVLLLCLPLALGTRRHAALTSPTSLLMCYAVVAAIAGVRSPNPPYALYWSVAVLAAIGVARSSLGRRQPTVAATALLWATWLATFVVTLGVIRSGGDAVFAGGAESYGIDKHIDVISSGVARWAAVCALVSFALCFQIRSRWWRFGLVVLTGIGFLIVYKMQSRGAVFGAVAAVLFLLILNRNVGRWAIPLLVAAGIFMSVSDYEGVVSDKVMTYLKRGGTDQDLYSMSGRTAYWEEGWKAFQEAPLLGRGQWTDRLLGIGHIHNSFLQALLNGGMLGFVPYLLSWLAGWRLFFQLWRKRSVLSPVQRISLNQCGAVLAFFTMRAIPETTTASYSPDLLMMLAVYAFMEATAYGLRQRRPVPNRAAAARVQPRQVPVAV